MKRDTSLLAFGHRAIVVVDVDLSKREAALAAGAVAVVDGSAADLAAEIIRVAGRPVLYAIDFVNATRTANAAFGRLDKGGTLILVGAAGAEMELSLAGMIFTARAVIGSQTGNL